MLRPEHQLSVFFSLRDKLCWSRKALCTNWAGVQNILLYYKHAGVLVCTPLRTMVFLGAVQF